MPRKTRTIAASTQMIRVFPDDADWINKEAIRRTRKERKRNTQYTVVHSLVESEKGRLAQNNDPIQAE
jgi:hypothetical protein